MALGNTIDDEISFYFEIFAPNTPWTLLVVMQSDKLFVGPVQKFLKLLIGTGIPIFWPSV